jgi:hypothetical protein
MTNVPKKARKRKPAEPDRTELVTLPDVVMIYILSYTTGDSRELTAEEYKLVAWRLLRAFLTEERGPLPDLPDLGKVTPLPDLDKVPA